MSEHNHVIKFDVKTYPCECGLEFSQELAETLVEAALSGSLPTVQLGIDLEFEKRRVAELEAENERYKKLLQDWVDIFDPRYTQDASLASAVRLVMDKSIEEHASDGRVKE